MICFSFIYIVLSVIICHQKTFNEVDKRLCSLIREALLMDTQLLTFHKSMKRK